jgi:uncharacterized protein
VSSNRWRHRLNHWPSAGIGRELAVQLAAWAGTLILLARRAGRLDELRTSLLVRHPQLQVLTLPVDLSDD